MSELRDLVRGWLRKADSDLAAMDAAFNAGVAFDTVCFHAQQAAEKALKAYLLAHGVDFPYTHDLARLLVLCETREPAFASLGPLASTLTPYATTLRYDPVLWPSLEVAREARDAAVTIRDFVLLRLPPGLAAPDTPSIA